MLTKEELRTRVADWRADAVKHAQEVLELRARLSTLLKASEGMEKALEEVSKWSAIEINGKKLNLDIVIDSLADFRAVKEGK